jgi:hypothetical protein
VTSPEEKMNRADTEAYLTDVTEHKDEGQATSMWKTEIGRITVPGQTRPIKNGFLQDP